MITTEIKSVRSKRTEATAIEEIQLLIGSLGHFPTVSEVTRFGEVGLSSFIQRNGGFNHYKKIMNHPTSKIKFWSEDNILNEIKNLNLEKFPTNNYLISIGRGDLSNAISKNGGWKYFSEKIGLPMPESDTLTGWEGEDSVENLLIQNGYKVKKMKTKDHFDFLINDVLRVDVKTASFSSYGCSSGWFYRMGKTISADFVILYRSDKKDMFFIPWHKCPSTNITITNSENSKYSKFYMNEEFFKNIIQSRIKENDNCPELIRNH